ncbi:hypothetical protein QBZ16_004853 [Prototheca wickerhamii]|uniref:Uncharacterized protein n=1 Tax=Prototheca wickerhamii TaxID=3111 RepID=A0AAD9MGM2_PROWI|nr:hypothetical protein QBZ16_004853 [Prototheca wickerhamii]
MELVGLALQKERALNTLELVKQHAGLKESMTREQAARLAAEREASSAKEALEALRREVAGLKAAQRAERARLGELDERVRALQASREGPAPKGAPDRLEAPALVLLGRLEKQQADMAVEMDRWRGLFQALGGGVAPPASAPPAAALTTGQRETHRESNEAARHRAVAALRAGQQAAPGPRPEQGPPARKRQRAAIAAPAPIARPLSPAEKEMGRASTPGDEASLAVSVACSPRFALEGLGADQGADEVSSPGALAALLGGLAELTLQGDARADEELASLADDVLERRCPPAIFSSAWQAALLGCAAAIGCADPPENAVCLAWTSAGDTLDCVPSEGDRDAGRFIGAWATPEASARGTVPALLAVAVRLSRRLAALAPECWAGERALAALLTRDAHRRVLRSLLDPGAARLSLSEQAALATAAAALARSAGDVLAVRCFLVDLACATGDQMPVVPAAAALDVWPCALPDLESGAGVDNVGLALQSALRGASHASGPDPEAGLLETPGVRAAAVQHLTQLGKRFWGWGRDELGSPRADQPRLVSAELNAWLRPESA